MTEHEERLELTRRIEANMKIILADPFAASFLTAARRRRLHAEAGIAELNRMYKLIGPRV